jgi:hypothetical protein
MTARTYADPPELAHMSGQFKLGYRQEREEERNAALEEAAKACEDQAQNFLDPAYAGANPLASVRERFACSQCAYEIRKLKT